MRNTITLGGPIYPKNKVVLLDFNESTKKHEWIVLPALPQNVGFLDSVSPQKKIDDIRLTDSSRSSAIFDREIGAGSIAEEEEEGNIQFSC